MSSDWKVPAAHHPKVADYAYDLDRALSAVVGIRTVIPADAFTADTLGTERAGNGVIIRENGLILTIGYLITEAEQVWLSTIDGRPVQGHVLGYDQSSGFGLVQALGRLNLPPLPIGSSAAVETGERVVIGGAGGRTRSVAARIVARQEFAGYWEYVLDDALFTSPSHPNWGGTALINAAGELVGLGSLQLQQAKGKDKTEQINMMVPIDLLGTVIDDMLSYGRVNKPPRPWLGLYATEVEDRIVVVGLADRGPAQEADLRTGDLVLAVNRQQVSDLANLYRRIWSMGQAGVEIPLTIYRDGKTFDVRVPSADRNRFFKAPSLH